jgi:putative endonuclease
MNPDHISVGKLGEDISERFLVKKGYTIIERNYRKKWGEIDIVAEKKGVVHFVEVKTVSCENIVNAKGGYRPEENVHPWKMKRLARAIQTYIIERRMGEREWIFDVLTVSINFSQKRAWATFLENIILEV